MGISPRYPPVTGRLHTRYAPVRRSPAVYCYTPLPLDLHVLSLPLAFILSQDQTLHCKNCLFILPLTRLVSLLPPRTGTGHTLSRCPKISMFSRFQVRCRQAAFSLKAGAKIQPFSKPPKFFFNYFLPRHTTGRTTSALRHEFFFRRNRKILKNHPAKGKKNPFFHTFSGSPKLIFREYLCMLLLLCNLNAFK